MLSTASRQVDIANRSRGGAGLLLHYLRPQWRRAALLLALLLSSIGLQLAGPQILRYFIDVAQHGGSLGALTVAALLFLGIAALNQAATSGASYLGQDVGWTATNALREDLANHCLHLDMGFHTHRTPGELIERIDGDVTAISTVFSQVVVTIFGSVLLLLGALVLLFREDWRVGLALSLFAVVAALVLVGGRSLAVGALRGSRQASAGLYGYIEERLSGLDDLRANGAGAYSMLRMHERARDLFNRGLHAENMQSVLWAATGGLFTFGTIMSLAMGAYLYHLGSISLGTVYLIFQYTEMLRAPIERITQQMQELQRAAAGLIRVRELLETRSVLPEDGSCALRPGPLEVAFEEVSFAYHEEPVLRGVSFRLAPGRVLGVVGRTGSGKTTLARLLLHLYNPTTGSVRVGGVDVREVLAEELRHRVGVVTQDVQIFHATVRDNLTLFDASVPDARVVACLERVGLGEWYRTLPDGLDTELAADSGGISAGEAQLLAFCRVFLRNPGLVILDEPSSRLDPATEARVERALDELLRGRTALIIAHRLATLARVDEVLVLEDGRIVEHGPRAALALERGSRYSDLLAMTLEATA